MRKVKKDKNGLVIRSAVFSGQNINDDGQIFNGANLKAIFGGIDIDLTNATIENNAEIKASAIFGGIDIKIPKDVAVTVKSTCIFGGVDNKTETKEATKTVYLKALCLFGGCDIKQ